MDEVLAAVALSSAVDASLKISKPYTAMPNEAAASWPRVNASCAGVYAFRGQGRAAKSRLADGILAIRTLLKLPSS